MREQALQQAHAEGLTLRQSPNNATGYAGVCKLSISHRHKPYQAMVRRGGKQVSLGSFAIAEEAALCVARSPEGQEAAERACSAPPPIALMTSEQALQQAQAEGLVLRTSVNRSGYANVSITSGMRIRPYHAQVRRGGKDLHLGSFATAEEAALWVARSPEGKAAAERAARTMPHQNPAQFHYDGQAVSRWNWSPEGQMAAERAAKRPAVPPPLTSEQALQQAQAEGLTLIKADTKSGYANVSITSGMRIRPYHAQVRRGGKDVHLGSFATAEEAALWVARSPEGKAAAERAARTMPHQNPAQFHYDGQAVSRWNWSPEGQMAAERAAKRPAVPPPLTSEQALQQAQAEGLTLIKADTKSGYANVSITSGMRIRPYHAQVRRGGKDVHLGSFATAEEAALCVARSPEGKAAAERRAAEAALPRPQLTREQALQRARDATIEAVALEIIYQAAEAAAIELGTEVAAEVMAGIALGL